MILMLLGFPQWLAYLIEGIFAFIALASGAVVLTRAGRSPYLTFLLLIPIVQIAAIWAFALTNWKRK